MYSVIYSVKVQRDQPFIFPDILNYKSYNFKKLIALFLTRIGFNQNDAWQKLYDNRASQIWNFFCFPHVGVKPHNRSISPLIVHLILIHTFVKEMNVNTLLFLSTFEIFYRI